MCFAEYNKLTCYISYNGLYCPHGATQMKKTEIHIRLSKSLKAKAYRIAQARGISISELIRHLIQKEKENQ